MAQHLTTDREGFEHEVVLAHGLAMAAAALGRGSEGLHAVAIAAGAGDDEDEDEDNTTGLTMHEGMLKASMLEKVQSEKRLRRMSEVSYEKGSNGAFLLGWAGLYYIPMANH